MPDFNGSIALFRHPEHLENQWLAHWNEARQHFNFVTADRLQQESYRECIDREIAWTLGLQRGQDYVVSSVARLHLTTELLQPGDDRVTKVAVEFYVADFYGRNSRQTVDTNPQARWLSSAEVLSGATSDGQPVSPLLVLLLKKADVIQLKTDG